MTLIYFVRLCSDFASFNARLISYIFFLFLFHVLCSIFASLLCSILPLFWSLVSLCSDLRFLFPIQGFFFCVEMIFVCVKSVMFVLCVIVAVLHLFMLILCLFIVILQCFFYFHLINLCVFYNVRFLSWCWISRRE